MAQSHRLQVQVLSLLQSGPAGSRHARTDLPSSRGVESVGVGVARLVSLVAGI